MTLYGSLFQSSILTNTNTEEYFACFLLYISQGKALAFSTD